LTVETPGGENPVSITTPIENGRAAKRDSQREKKLARFLALDPVLHEIANFQEAAPQGGKPPKEGDGLSLSAFCAFRQKTNTQIEKICQENS